MANLAELERKKTAPQDLLSMGTEEARAEQASAAPSTAASAPSQFDTRTTIHIDTEDDKKTPNCAPSSRFAEHCYAAER